MRPYVRVRMLTREEYEELKRMERRRKLAASKVQRARIILLSTQGYLMREIASALGCHEKTASRWIGRFNRLGMAGLEEYLLARVDRRPTLRSRWVRSYRLRSPDPKTLNYLSPPGHWIGWWPISLSTRAFG